MQIKKITAQLRSISIIKQFQKETAKMRSQQQHNLTASRNYKKSEQFCDCFCNLVYVPRYRNEMPFNCFLKIILQSAVLVPVFVLQMRILLGKFPCDEKLEKDKSNAGNALGNEACLEMLKQRHGWIDADLVSNADTKQTMNREKDELCRISTFVLDHARGQVPFCKSLLTNFSRTSMHCN